MLGWLLLTLFAQMGEAVVHLALGLRVVVRPEPPGHRGLLSAFSSEEFVVETLCAVEWERGG